MQPQGQVLLVSKGAVLLEALQAAGIPVSSSCGGNGTCGTCRVLIQASDAKTLPPRNDLEEEMNRDRRFPENERLSCQWEVQQNLTILIPSDSGDQ